LSDAEWALVAPLIPPSKHGGRPRSVNVREVLNAIFYVLWTGCQWKALPKDFPPKSTVYDDLDLWEWDGTLEPSTMRSAFRNVSGRGAKRARRRRSSTARRRVAPQKGGIARPVGL